jgi:hypothetical protein
VAIRISDFVGKPKKCGLPWINRPDIEAAPVWLDSSVATQPSWFVRLFLTVCGSMGLNAELEWPDPQV